MYNDIKLNIGKSTIELNFNNNEDSIVQLKTDDQIIWDFGIHGHSDYANIYIGEDKIYAEIISWNDDSENKDQSIGFYYVWKTQVELISRIKLGELLLGHIDLPVKKTKLNEWVVNWDDISE